MKNPLLASLALAVFACALPAQAQESSYTPGAYWDVSMVDIEDGQEEVYADFLSKQWKKNQEFAKSKGYIEDYMVLANVYGRADEPDLYLMVKFKTFFDNAEEMRQQKEFEAMMKKDTRKLVEESGMRGKIRTLKGSMMLRELDLK